MAKPQFARAIPFSEDIVLIKNTSQSSVSNLALVGSQLPQDHVLMLEPYSIKLGLLTKQPLYNGAIITTCPSGVTLIWRTGNKVQVTDTNRKPTTPYLFSSITAKDFYCDRPTRLEAEGGYRFLGLDGRLLDTPFFENALHFNGRGFALVRDNNHKWGIIDITGRYSAQPRYKMLIDIGSNPIYNLNADLYYAIENYQISWINSQGIEVLEPKATPSPEREKHLECSSGIKITGEIVNGEKLWGFVDQNGAELIKPKYRAVACPNHKANYVYLSNEKLGKWCILSFKNGTGALSTEELNACKVVDYCPPIA